jgi:hypothetical protein
MSAVCVRAPFNPHLRKCEGEVRVRIHTQDMIKQGREFDHGGAKE